MAQNNKGKPKTEIDEKQMMIDKKVAELSIQKRAEGLGVLAGGNFADTMWFVRQYDDTLVAPWWSEQRDVDLRSFVLRDGNDILQGAISSLIKKIKALPWFLEGPDRVVNRYQSILANSEFGQGWSILLSKVLYDYLTQDKGAFVEFIGAGKLDGPITGPVLGMAHLDAAMCQLTGDPVYPVLYRNPKAEKKQHKLHATRVGHIVDTPSPNEIMNNIGFCSTSRVIASSQVLLKLAQYKNEKLDDLPEAGLLLFNNLMPIKWEDARKTYQMGRRRLAQDIWSPIMTLFGIDPAQPVTAQLISFANLPEHFNERESIDIYVNIVALGFGVDTREFWPMSGGQLGTATETQVMHQKAKGKGPGEIISSIERLINWHILPENVTFKFDVQDDEEDALRATVNRTKTDTIMTMWKPPGAAEMAAGAVSPVTSVEIRQMLADNVPYFNKEFLEVDITDEVTVSDVDQEEADDITKMFGRNVRTDCKGNTTTLRRVKQLSAEQKVLALAEQNFRDGKIGLDDLIEFRLGTVLDGRV